MSAIFGILRFDGSEASARDLERVSNTLARRGPEGRRYSVAGPIGLGHCLMRVNQEDLFERQPLHDHEADLTVVADCRIDNRDELAGIFRFNTAQLREMPDSALVLRAYKAWGEHCAEHLIGDFAFAIWDGRAKRLLLARDHMGQRSIFYHRAADFFIFATEPAALWAVPDVPRKLCEIALGRHLLFANARSGNATLYEDILHVPGGSTVVVGADGEVSERRYWQPHADPAWLDRTEEEYVERYRTVVAEAVECRIRRLIAPPALCLSGGFDSSAIAGLAGPVLTTQGRKLIAVSSVLPEGEDNAYNPRGAVELCRRHMRHIEVRYVARSHELGFDNLERAFLRSSGIPNVDHNITDILFQEASAAGARLMMDGIGGDGTVNPRGGTFLHDLLRTGQVRRFLLEAGAHLRTGARSPKQILIDDIIRGLTPFWMRSIWRTLRHGGKAVWADRPIAPSFATRLLDAGTLDRAEVIARLRPYMSTRTKMQSALLRLMAMPAHHFASEAAARGLDLTRPMLDKRVVELSRAIPEHLYVRDGRDRHLARRALASFYPPEFATRLSALEARRPGYHRGLQAELPKLSSEVRQLSRDAVLQNYIDFATLERGFARFDNEPGLVRGGAHTLRAFYAARYIAWFQGGNS